MNRIDFKQLLKRYVAGTSNEQEKALIDQWYDLLYNDNIKALTNEELDIVEQQMWNKIEEEANFTKHVQKISSQSRRLFILKLTAAAAILVMATVGIYYTFSEKQVSLASKYGKEKDNLTEVQNTTTFVKSIQLDDGSIIRLQPLTKFAYPAHFAGDKREVYLEGEAFFEVTKNASKPFLVHSGNILTQVLGTSFTIKPTKENNQIEVSVKTGKVAVFEDTKQVSLNNEQQKNNGTIITPNQKVVYNSKVRNFATALVEMPEPVVSSEDSAVVSNSFVFDDVPLVKVLENISKTYSIEVLVENENIYKCTFTGNITSQSIYDKLALICQSTNNIYEIKGTKILIKGKGCVNIK
jgi:transmembrane sensor